MSKLKTIFMGTPDFAIPCLEKVYENTDLKLILTKEDKPNTRGRKIKYLPVKEFAIKNNIEYIQPKSVRTDEIFNKLKEINPDVIIVVAYGKIIPKNIIDLPKYIINVHSSILPKYRGASPIHSAIINGDTKTGVTIMKIDEGLDTGNILKIKEIDIDIEDTLGTLHNKLSKIGAEALMEVIQEIQSGNVKEIKQDDSKATHVYPIKKEETKIDLEKDKNVVYNLIRGLNPVPLAYAYLGDKIIKFGKTHLSDKVFLGKNGSIHKEGNNIYLKLENGSLLLEELKLEGKPMLKAIDLYNGRIISDDTILH